MIGLDFWDCEICDRPALYWTVVPIRSNFTSGHDLIDGYCEKHAKNREVLTRDQIDVLVIMES